MIYEDYPRGRAKIVNYVPTVPALRYLPCCTMAGWHRCNEQYGQAYQDEVDDAFLLYTVDGMGHIEAGGKTYALGPDSVVAVPPHTPMRYYTDQKVGVWEFYWLNLAGDRALSTVQTLWEDGHGLVRDLPPLMTAFNGLLNESSAETERGELLERVMREVVCKAVFHTSEQESVADRVLRYITEHYTERPDLHRLSERFYLSQNQLIRVVRARTGYTPHEYLVRVRLTKACGLLQSTDKPIGEIGRAVGYCNDSHFSAAFRHLYGITPAEYRERFSPHNPPVKTDGFDSPLYTRGP